MLSILTMPSNTVISVFQSLCCLPLQVTENSTADEVRHLDVGWIKTPIANILIKDRGRTDPVEPERSWGLAKSTKRPTGTSRAARPGQRPVPPFVRCTRRSCRRNRSGQPFAPRSPVQPRPGNVAHRRRRRTGAPALRAHGCSRHPLHEGPPGSSAERCGQSLRLGRFSLSLCRGCVKSGGSGWPRRAASG